MEQGSSPENSREIYVELQTDESDKLDDQNITYFLGTQPITQACSQDGRSKDSEENYYQIAANSLRIPLSGTSQQFSENYQPQEFGDACQVFDVNNVQRCVPAVNQLLDANVESHYPDSFDPVQSNASSSEYETDETSLAGQLFEIDLILQLKDFQNQRNGKGLGPFKITCNSSKDFRKKLWEKVSQHIKKQILFKEDSNSCEWGTEQLTYKDLNRFLIFQNKTSKRPVHVDQLTSKLLHSWMKRNDIVGSIMAYGCDLRSKDQFVQANKTLMQPVNVDRAGAASNKEVTLMVKKLKELHKNNLLASDISWFRWANMIIASDAHKQEEMMNALPPPSIIQLFSQAREPPQERLQQVSRSIAIGQRVNRDVAPSVQHVSTGINEIIEVLEKGLAAAKLVRSYTESLQLQLKGNETLLQAFDEAVGPTEDQFGLQLLNDIEDVEDIDHAAD